ncbi:MAG: ABC transporter permease [Christensenellaceae bacterium]
MIKTPHISLKQGKFKEALKNNFSIIGLFLVIMIFAVLTKGKLLKVKNLYNIFNNLFSIGLGAMGVMFVMSLGELDLSVGAIVGMSSAFAAFAGQANLALILPVALLTGLLIGAVNGLTIAYLRVESFIGTLAVSFVVRGLTTWLLNGSVGIPVSQRVFDQSFVKIIVFIVVAIVLFALFELTSYGKHSRAIGSSMEAARQSGVKVKKVRMTAFMISGLICGLIGFFSLVRTCTASSNTGNAFEFDVLLAVLFGGMPLAGGWAVKFRSAIIGALSMAIMSNGMSLMGISGLTQQVIQGIILVAIVTISFDRRNALVIK